MAGCSKKQYAIMMSAGPEGKKLASEMGGMEQDKFNEAFAELLNSDSYKPAEGEAKYSKEEDEDYREFDETNDDDFGFDEEDEPGPDESNYRAYLDGEMSRDEYEANTSEKFKKEHPLENDNNQGEDTKIVSINGQPVNENKDDMLSEANKLKEKIERYHKNNNEELSPEELQNELIASDELSEIAEKYGIDKSKLIDKMNGSQDNFNKGMTVDAPEKGKGWKKTKMASGTLYEGPNGERYLDDNSQDNVKYLAPEEIGIDYDNPEASIKYYEKKNNVKLYEQPNGSFKVVPNKERDNSQSSDNLNPNNPKYKGFERSSITNAELVDEGYEFTDADTGEKRKESIISYIPYGSLQDGDNRRLYALVNNYDGTDTPKTGAIVAHSLEDAKDQLERQTQLGIQGRDRYLKRGQYDEDYFNLVRDNREPGDDEKYKERYGWDFNKPFAEHDFMKNDPYEKWKSDRIGNRKGKVGDRELSLNELIEKTNKLDDRELARDIIAIQAPKFNLSEKEILEYYDKVGNK